LTHAVQPADPGLASHAPRHFATVHWAVPS
jgi:hypothetical protein